MYKALLAVVLAVLMLTSTALAEVYEGTTVAASTIQVEAATAGTLDTLNVRQGEVVSEGDVIGSVRTTKVFATQDGTIARINVDEGNTADGTVLEIIPVERYQIYCSVDGAYQSVETTFVHSGELVYIKCTTNGTHRAIGQITKIDNDEFRVMTVGGELYIGETVYLYRDEEFSNTQRVGLGTVVSSDTEVYESNGLIVKMHVTEGEYVERGELLYEIVEANGEWVLASATGIISEVHVNQGDQIKNGQTVISIVPQEQICVEIQMDEMAAGLISEGDTARLVYAFDSEEVTMQGTVIAVSGIPVNERYCVRIQPEETKSLRLGMSIIVRIDE